MARLSPCLTAASSGADRFLDALHLVPHGGVFLPEFAGLLCQRGHDGGQVFEQVKQCPELVWLHGLSLRVGGAHQGDGALFIHGDSQELAAFPQRPLQ